MPFNTHFFFSPTKIIALPHWVKHLWVSFHLFLVFVFSFFLVLFSFCHQYYAIFITTIMYVVHIFFSILCFSSHFSVRILRFIFVLLHISFESWFSYCSYHNKFSSLLFGFFFYFLFPFHLTIVVTSLECLEANNMHEWHAKNQWKNIFTGWMTS